MRVLVIGASGFIGRYLVKRFSASPESEVFCTFHARPPGDDANHWYHLELTDPVMLEKLFGLIQPDVVVHLAAMADVGTAEREPAMATAVNVAATSEIARLCNSHNARLLFVSTEYVFDGERGFYREDDTPNPTTHYGRTKWEAEQEVAWLAYGWNVIRTSIVYGWPAPGRRNFVPSLIGRLRGGQPYSGSTEVMRTPVYVEHLVDGITNLVEEFRPGIHHVAGRDWVSMYDFALAVADGFGIDRELVLPANAPQGTQPTSTSKPDRLGLDCARTMSLLGIPHFGLADGIAAMRAAAVGDVLG